VVPQTNPTAFFKKKLYDSEGDEIKNFGIALFYCTTRNTPPDAMILDHCDHLISLSGGHYGAYQPAVTNDSCMDGENWSHCRNLEINGCQSPGPPGLVRWLRAGNDGTTRSFHRKPYSSPSVPEPIGEPPSMFNSTCTATSIVVDRRFESTVLPLWIHPGSDCYSDATMPPRQDQYCDPRTMTYHENVIVGSVPVTCIPVVARR
jgi:hypothetical protein